MRVLVVDDHRNTSETLALGLTLLGLAAETASDAQEALVRLGSGAYDVLVSDVRMPGTGGIELAQTARHSHEGLGLILITAYDVTPRERAVIDQLEAQLLIKPVTAEAVVRCCARTMTATGRRGTE